MERIQNENLGPKYALRLSDLGHWHRFQATCFRCRHSAIVNPEVLRQRWPAHSKLGDLERKLRCRACGNRYGNTLSVGRLARN